MNYTLKDFFEEMKITKQAVHQSRKRQICFDNELEEMVKLADLLKKEHPGCGVEKMYYTLQPDYVGRDKFCEIFLSLGYGVKKIKNYRRTTYPSHLSYPNLIEGMQLIRPNQVVQSDITYFYLHGRFYYLIFIIDVYTREIVSYRVNDHMRAEANIEALNEAMKNMTFNDGGLIHHSDRGVQYASNAYTQLLKTNGIHVSMGLIATDNAYAERVNGIIKNEYLAYWEIKDEKALRRKTKDAVNHYNQNRKHRGHGMKYSPLEFKEYWLSLNAQQRPKVIIYTEGKVNLKGASSPIEICPTKEPQAHNCPMEIEFNV